MSQPPETRPSLLIRLREVRDAKAWSQFVEVYAPLIYGIRLQSADCRTPTPQMSHKTLCVRSPRQFGICNTIGSVGLPGTEDQSRQVAIDGGQLLRPNFQCQKSPVHLANQRMSLSDAWSTKRTVASQSSPCPGWFS